MLLLMYREISEIVTAGGFVARFCVNLEAQTLLSFFDFQIGLIVYCVSSIIFEIIIIELSIPNVKSRPSSTDLLQLP